MTMQLTPNSTGMWQSPPPTFYCLVDQPPPLHECWEGPVALTLPQPSLEQRGANERRICTNFTLMGLLQELSAALPLRPAEWRESRGYWTTRRSA